MTEQLEKIASLALDDKPDDKEKASTFKDFSLVVSDGQLFTEFTEDELAEILKVKGVSPMDTTDTEAKPEVSSSPFVDAAKKESQRSLTENRAPTYNTSGDPLVDFYFHVMEQVDSERTLQMLIESWKSDPLCALKLIAILRDIRSGKGIRRQYQECLYWLYNNHPTTLYKNLEKLMRFGYMKDILQFLMIILFDGFVHPYFLTDEKAGSAGKNVVGLTIQPQIQRGFRRGFSRKKVTAAKKIKASSDKEKRIYNQLVLDSLYKDQASGDSSAVRIVKKAENIKGSEMVQARITFLRKKFKEDSKYRAFHLLIAKIFAAELYSDGLKLKQIAEKKKEKVESQDKGNEKEERIEVSLAGKWGPTLEGHVDRYTFLASTISIELLRLMGVDREAILLKPVPLATYLARRIYAKEYLSPLRKFHEVPEVYMSANNWDKVNYKRVPAKSMIKNKAAFIVHDKERFELYLSDKKNKVAGGSLKPIEIILGVFDQLHKEDPIEIAIIEKQWISLCESIKNKGGGVLNGAISICDVSGSMSGLPMAAAIGLTLMTMEMTQPPWNSLCLTFSENPEIFDLSKYSTLMEKASALQQMNWGGSTNLHASFELILNLGLKEKLTQEQMPKLLLIFTDMEFDHACPGTQKTNIEAAKELYLKHGYELPSLVLWNLRGSSSTPVQVDERGVTLMSGFSAQQLEFIMKHEDLSKTNPIDFVMGIINEPRYDCLKIYD